MNAPPILWPRYLFVNRIRNYFAEHLRRGGGSTKNKIYPKRIWFICYQNRPRSKFYHIFIKHNLGNTFWDSTYYFILELIVFSQKLLKNTIIFRVRCTIHVMTSILFMIMSQVYKKWTVPGLYTRDNWFQLFHFTIIFNLRIYIVYL